MGEKPENKNKMKQLESVAYKIKQARNNAGEYRKLTRKEQVAIFWDKTKKEAIKLSFAVVVAEFIIAGIIAISCHFGAYELLQPKTIIITNTAEAKTIKPEEVKEIAKIDEVEDLAIFIWNKESSRGKNNYSQCEKVGKVNGIGYGIDGTGKYQCFNSHEEEMQVLRGWIIDHESQGFNRLQMLKHYTPSYTEAR